MGLEVARVGLHRCGAALPMLACAGAVGAAHLRAPGVGGNRGIMPNSNDDGGRGWAPMCADPPHRTWEPNHHTRRFPEKPIIPTKPAPASQRPRPPMCNTNRRPCPIDAPQTHPPCSTPRSVHVRLKIGPIQPGRPDVEARTTSSGSEDHLPHLETTGKQQTRNSATDLDAEYDRSRGRVRPISSRNTTDIDAGCDRSRRGGAGRTVHRRPRRPGTI